jgi:uncharacterized membrane protein
MELTTATRGAKAPGESMQQRAADAITAFCGTMTFVYLHAAAFAAWIATRGFGQDAFPTTS